VYSKYWLYVGTGVGSMHTAVLTSHRQMSRYMMYVAEWTRYNLSPLGSSTQSEAVHMWFCTLHIEICACSILLQEHKVATEQKMLPTFYWCITILCAVMEIRYSIWFIRIAGTRQSINFKQSFPAR